MLSAIITFLLKHLIAALMLSVGLAARRSDLATIVPRWRFYARAIVVVELAVPLVALAAVMAFDVPPIATAMILLMAICPGAPFIPLAHRAEGEAYNVVGLNLLVITSVLAPLTIPLWVAAVGGIHGLHLVITPAQILAKVVPLVLGPLLLGVVIQAIWPRGARVLWRAAHYLFIVALAVAIVLVIVRGAQVLAEVPLRSGVAALVVVLAAALLGYWAASPQPEDRPTMMDIASLGNPMLALAVLAASYPGYHAAAFAAAYLLFRVLVSLPAKLWVKRRHKRRTPG